jgi:hypothetical protein
MAALVRSSVRVVRVVVRFVVIIYKNTCTIDRTPICRESPCPGKRNLRKKQVQAAGEAEQALKYGKTGVQRLVQVCDQMGKP